MFVSCGSEKFEQGSRAPSDAAPSAPAVQATRQRTDGGSDAAPNDVRQPSSEEFDAGEADEPERLQLPPGWTPNNLPGVTSWFFASSGDVVSDGVRVSQWLDHRADHRGAGQQLVQTFVPGQPELRTGDWNGGEPTIRFSGGNLMTRDTWSGSPTGTNAGFTLLAVIRSERLQDAGVAGWWAPAGGVVWAGVRSMNTLTLLDFTRMDVAVAAQMHTGNQDLGITAGHVVAWRFSPSTQTVKLTVDGATSTGARQPALGGISQMPLIVGATSTLPTGLFKGDISELVFVDRDLSDDEVQTFTEYAQGIWHLMGAAGSGPCIRADLQPSPKEMRCDDGNPATFGDHCSAGSCVGTVPGTGSPNELGPVAWYHAGAPEVVITGGGVTTWYDRAAGRRDLLNGWVGRPLFSDTGWNGDMPTLTFLGSHALRRQEWTVAPTGTEQAFSVLAVVRPTSSNGGVAGWWNPAGGKVWCQFKPSGGATVADLSRVSDWPNVAQDFAADVDPASERHAVVWRYGDGVTKVTVDGFTRTQSQSPIGLISGDQLVVGATSPQPTDLFSGDISELAVIPRSISDNEVARFNDYAQGEWHGLILCAPNCAGKPPGAEDGCGGNCGASPGGACASDGDCGPGFVCGVNNGACFDGARAERRCWPVACTDGVDASECGTPTSPCGQNCGCAKPCQSDQPTSQTNSCPTGESCIRNLGNLLGAPSRDACGPSGPGGCPSNDPALCGTPTSLCGPRCVCTPDCAQATAQNPGDGCGNRCPNACPTGLAGCCAQDSDCQAGAVCLTDPTGARTCRSASTCANRALRPPLCGSPGAVCGDQCPTCTPQCGGRQCGPDPNCGASCGTCSSGQICDAAGQCVTPTADPPVTVPRSNGPQPLPDIPPVPASGVGATPGQFTVTDQGTAQYTVPIGVPPGRAGMEPALSLVYAASRDNGSVGIGWRLDGLQKITRCPRTFALDGYSRAVKNDTEDVFCLDGKRLINVKDVDGILGHYGREGTEYRTLIDSFSKIVSHQDQSNPGPQLDPVFGTVAHVLPRPDQGPDSFEVRTKDGRILTFGGTHDSLVMLHNGVRQTWLIKRIEDRAGNTILFNYDNSETTLSSSALPDNRLSYRLHPSRIAYTGHGNVAGNRSVRFTYEPRTDPALHFLQGGIPWALEDRLVRITTYVDEQAVKNYHIRYEPGTVTSIVQTITECEGDGDAHCKLPTQFSYERSEGYELAPGPGAGAIGDASLDVNGDGLPDFMRTDVSIEGEDVRTDPALEVAKIAVNIGVSVATHFMLPEVGIFVNVLWSLVRDDFWGMFEKKPEVKLKFESSLQINPGIRGERFPSADVHGLPCDWGNSFHDYNQDGKDDVICSPTGEQVRVGLSTGGATFQIHDPHVSIPPLTGGFKQIPYFFDIDGDSLVDILSCTSVYPFDNFIELRRRTAPDAGFDPPVRLRAPCGFLHDKGFAQNPAAVFDVDGDGTQDLLTNRIDEAQGEILWHEWQVLRYRFSVTTGEAELYWEPFTFPNVALNDLSNGGLQLADMNNDGLMDVLKVDPTFFNPAALAIGEEVREVGNNVTVWLNTGGGGFIGRTMPHPDRGFPEYDIEGHLHGRDLRKIAVADYDNDGRADLLESWQFLDRTICDHTVNSVLFPNSGLSAIADARDPQEFVKQRRGGACDTEAAAIRLVSDFDGDGSTDINVAGDIYYGKAGHAWLLTRVQDGLGAVTNIKYDKPSTDDGLPTYDSTCTGPTWPERCLKRMSGLVAEHTEGFKRDGDVAERRFRYTYSNARMSTTGHGWLGFEKRTIRETALPSLGLPEDTEFSDVLTTIRMEPVVRRTRLGTPMPDLVQPPFLYPLAGLPKTIEIDQTKAQSPLETNAYRRRTRITNHWEPRVSADVLLFPHLEDRKTSVYEAVVTSPVTQDGALLSECTETMVPDPYGNDKEQHKICADEDIFTQTTFDPDPATWLISNPELVSVRSTRPGAPAQTQKSEFNYYASGLLFSVTRSPNGPEDELRTTTYGRDVFGNVESVTESVATLEAPRLTITTYDADHVHPTTIRNPQGHLTQVRYDRFWGAPKTIVDPNGIAVQHGYDGLGLLAETRDPGGVTHYARSITSSNEVFTPVGTIRPRYKVDVTRRGTDGTPGPGSSLEYDHRTRLVRTTTDGFAGRQLVAQRAYDNGGRLIGATLPHREDTGLIPFDLVSYDGFDRVKRVTHSDGKSAQVQYASAISLNSGLGHWLRGRDCTVTDSCFTEIELSVDEAGKRDLVVKNRSGLIGRNIDGENLASGAGAMRTSDFKYGAFNRLLDSYQNQSGAVPSDGAISRRSYDAYGRLLSIADADSGTTRYAYNAFDDLITSRDGKDQLRTYTHDQLGRLRKVVDPAGTTEWIFDLGANGIGRISEMISPATPDASLGQHVVYNYEPASATNNRGLLQRIDYKIDEAVYPIEMTYDTHARKETMSYPNLGNGSPVKARYHYDDFGYLFQIDEIGSGTPRPIWFLNGAFQGARVQHETFGDDSDVTYTYDEQRRWLNTINTSSSAGVIQDIAYSHYENGLIFSRTRNGIEVRTHFYDELNRLGTTIDSPAPGAPGVTKFYDYDRFGNMTQRGATTLSYAPAQPHLLATVGNNSYQYDLNGNASQRLGPDIPGSIQNIEYTPFNLPRVVVSGLGQGMRTTRFEYSADGQRLVQREDDRTRHFATGLYQHVVSSTGATIEERFRLYAGEREIAQIVREGGVDTTLYFHPDNIGTADVISTSGGQAIRQEFDPFGLDVHVPSLEVTRTGFTGHEHDRDLGLIDMRGRVYDPLAARFLTPDPVTQAPFWSPGLNRYAYVFNNPINGRDPSGFTSIFDNRYTGAWVAGSLALAFLAPVGYQALDVALSTGGAAGVVNTGLSLLSLTREGLNAASANQPDPSNGAGDLLCVMFPMDEACTHRRNPFCDVITDIPCLDDGPALPKAAPKQYPIVPRPVPIYPNNYSWDHGLVRGPTDEDKRLADLHNKFDMEDAVHEGNHGDPGFLGVRPEDWEATLNFAVEIKETVDIMLELYELPANAAKTPWDPSDVNPSTYKDLIEKLSKDAYNPRPVTEQGAGQ
jgi:RHS repeat-associated protein